MRFRTLIIKVVGIFSCLLATTMSQAGNEGGGVSDVFLMRASFGMKANSYAERPAERFPRLIFVDDENDRVVYFQGGKVISRSINELEQLDPELLDTLDGQFFRLEDAKSI